MNGFAISNFRLIPTSDPATTSAVFDIDFIDGTTANNVSLSDNGTRIHLGIEVSPNLRKEIIEAAMKEARRLQQ